MAGLTFAQLREVVNGNRSRFQRDFKETQPRRAYPITKLVMSKAETVDPSNTIEWSIRRSAANGSIQAVNAYEEVEGVRSEYDVSLAITPKHYVTHKEMLFSKLAATFMKSSPEKLWDDYKMKRSSAEENWWEFWENKVWDVPYTATAKDAFFGWLYWLARSMTSGGVFTEQLRPARNGVYARLGDGTLVSTAAGQDRSTAANSRLRTLVATHRGVLDETMLNTLEDCVIESQIEYIETLQGEKPSMSPMTLVWDQVFERAYRRLLNKLGTPSAQDFFGSGAKRLASLPTVGAPVLDGHFLRPVFGIRHSNMRLLKFRGNWGLEHTVEKGHDVLFNPRTWSAQGKAEEPTTAGFLCHGSFTTGT